MTDTSEQAGERRDQSIKIRLTASEKQRLQEAVNQSGGRVNLSDLARRRLLEQPLPSGVFVTPLMQQQLQCSYRYLMTVLRLLEEVQTRYPAVAPTTERVRQMIVSLDTMGTP